VSDALDLDQSTDCDRMARAHANQTLHELLGCTASSTSAALLNAQRSVLAWAGSRGINATREQLLSTPEWVSERVPVFGVWLYPRLRLVLLACPKLWQLSAAQKPRRALAVLDATSRHRHRARAAREADGLEDGGEGHRLAACAARRGPVPRRAGPHHERAARMALARGLSPPVRAPHLGLQRGRESVGASRS
jgi:hypothetical protein